jgi:Helix-turn-helix domain
MTVAELVAALERRAADAERVGATAPVANVYRDVLSELRNAESAGAAVVATRSASPPAPEPDRWLTPAAVAARLDVAVRWVYRHARELGGVKVGKYLRIPESSLRRRMERRR